MPQFRVCSTGELTPGNMMEAGAGGVEIVVCNVAGVYFALQNECPHAGGPLAHGALHGHHLVCPFHAWEFDCRTGEYDYNPDVCLERYAVEVKDGEVFVSVD